ncbi:MAG: SOS response-associated peptidase [Ignavibacteriales bacterium]|nr:SOS response-associated peptidase [Ignavibacteriales bacterium]
MCGRYAIIDGKKIFLTFEKLKDLEVRGQAFEMLPRYNAAPTDSLPVIAMRRGMLGVERMRWWLIPHTSQDGQPLSGSDNRPLSAFNAKSETLETSKLFGPYFQNARCLVPADAFYEWKKINVTKEVRGKRKEFVERQPMAFKMKDDRMLMFAGLFSVWRNEQGQEFPSFAIITTEPNELMKPIHNRMPVILDEKDFEEWTDRNNKSMGDLKKLLVPYPAEKMKAYPVAKFVSSSRNDVPECLEPARTEDLLL